MFSQVTDKGPKKIYYDIPAEPSKKKKDSIPVKVKVAPKLEKKDDKAGGKSEEKKKYVIKGVRKTFFYDRTRRPEESLGEIYEEALE